MTKKWMSIAPIENSRWHSSVLLPVDFDNGVRIDRMPKWAYSTDILSKLVLADSERIQGSKNAFLVDYEAAALGSPGPEEKGSMQRSVQSIMHEKISLANLGLWLSNPNAIGFFAIIHFDEVDVAPSLRQYEPVRAFHPHLDYEKRILLEQDFQLAAGLYRKLLRLDRKGTIWRAAYSIWLGMLETDWAARYMQMWIAMESLFGPEDAREITFRISQRIALFLMPDKIKAHELFLEVKESYSWRSKVAHGLRLSKLQPDESEVLSYSIEQLTAFATAKILSETQWIEKFESTQREEFLDNLVFQR